MVFLVTPRLVLVPLSGSMMRRRLADESFHLTCRLPDGEVPVHLPASWPGDAVAMFAALIRNLPPDGEDVPGQFTAVSTDTASAVGLVGLMGDPGPAGARELGYGFNPEVQGQGLATEAVAAVAEHLLTWSTISTVTARTATANPASARVAEKSGFIRDGTSWSEDDGDLVTWRFDPPPAPR